MNALVDRYTAFVTRLTPVSRCAWLIGIVAMVWAVAAAVAHAGHGVAGVRAVSLAAAVCLCSAVVAVVLASIHSGTQAAVGWILAGDGIAMAIPLATGMLVTERSVSLAEAGLFNWIVLFFLVSLATKTLLIAPLVQAKRTAAPSVGDAAAKAVNLTTANATATTKVGA